MSSRSKQSKQQPTKRPPPEREDEEAEVEPDEDLTTNTALAAFEAQFNKAPKAARIIKASGGGGASLRGIVLRWKDVTIEVDAKDPADPNRKRKTPKREFHIAITSIDTRDGADMACAGAFNYLLPTNKKGGGNNSESGGPEGGGRGGGNGGSELIIADGFLSVYLGVVKCSAFKEGGDGKAKGGVDLCVVGMPVELYNVRATPGKDGTGLFLNAGSIKPSIEAGLPLTGVTGIIQEQIRSSAQLGTNSAQLLAMAYHGFYDCALTDEDQKAQAEVFKAEFAKTLTTLASACDSKAAQLRCVPNHAAACVLDQHVTTLRQMDPADVAKGAPLFNPHLPHNADYPMHVAAFWQKGVSPAFNRPAQIMRLYEGPEVRAGLPKTFAELTIRSVQMDGKKMCIVQAGGLFVGDSEKAVEAISRNGTPVLQFPDEQGVAFKLMLRDLAVGLGVKVYEKAATCVAGLIPWADCAMFLPITPRAVGDNALNAPLASGFFWDVPATVAQAGALVSEKWCVEHLANGDERGSRYDEPEDVEMVNFKDREGHDIAAPPRTLKKHGFAACSEVSFGFARENMPIDKPNRAYFVVGAGVAEGIAANKKVNTDAAAGEALVKQLADALNYSTLAGYLAAEAVVFCVAMPLD
jgi:hypothetical protein